MQLDKTHIAIRERDYLDILDLSLMVMRVHFWPLLLAFAIGATPFILLQHFLVGGFDSATLQTDEFSYDYDTGFQTEFFWRLGRTSFIVLLLAIFIPLATAPATLYLGQAMFLEKIDMRRLFKDWLSSLPQLILLQVLLRSILIAFIFTAVIPFTVWPYLNEIILLERNSLFRGNRSKMTTMRRSSALQSASMGELFGRWLIGIIFATGWVVVVLLALWALKLWTAGNLEISRLTFLIYLEIALWSAVCYFTVVRFLSYLDLRIRREGWEVELRMRAEAARMAEQLA